MFEPRTMVKFQSDYAVATSHINMRCPIVVIVLAVTWLLEPTFASRPKTLNMSIVPGNANDYYVEEKGSKDIECLVVTDVGVEFNLTWSGPSVNASKPQLTSFIPRATEWQFGNWLNITQFSDADAGKYECTAKTPTEYKLSRPITINKKCDIRKFDPPSCTKNCSKYCKPRSDGVNGRTCNHKNGSCLYGCQEGHAGLLCTDCVAGKFSPPSCNESCSTYCKLGLDGTKGRTCDHTNGTCLHGCQEGYTGDLCTDKLRESGGSRDAELAWIALPITIVFIIFVLCVVPKTGKRIRQKLHACWRREKQPRRSEEATSRNAINKEEGTSLLDISPVQNNSRQGNGPENSTGTGGQRGGVTPNGNSNTEVDGTREQRNGSKEAAGAKGQGDEREDRIWCQAQSISTREQCRNPARPGIIFCTPHKRRHEETFPGKPMGRDRLKNEPNLRKELEHTFL